MAIEVEVKCRDYGEEGCLGDPDPQYTMRWDDIGEEPLYWCSAVMLAGVLDTALSSRR